MNQNINALFEAPRTGAPAPAKKHKRKANDLDGAKWLTNSISIWSDIRKSGDELSLKHPAMFPSMLAKRFIETFTNKSQNVVLDPFLGSGSTLVAARQCGKMGIGVELSAEFAKLAKNRMERDLLASANAPPHRIHVADSQSLSHFIEANGVDITVTSPPYWDILNQQRTVDGKDIRHYGNLPGDLGVIHDYRCFIDSLQRVFEQVHLVMKPERYCIVVVMDLRKKDKFFAFHSDVAEMMQRVGFMYDDLIIWNRQSEYNNLRPLGYPSVFRVNKVHEFCLIFKTKGRNEKAARDKELLAAK